MYYNKLYLKFKLSNHRGYLSLYQYVCMWFKAESSSYAGNMNTAGNMTMEIWNMVLTARNMGWYIIRGNHARQPCSSSPKRRNLHWLFVLKIKIFCFFRSKYFFGIIKHLYTLLSGLFGEILPEMMNPPRSGYINNKCFVAFVLSCIQTKTYMFSVMLSDSISHFVKY